MSMEENQDGTALETIDLLESRLQRIHFLLTGRSCADADVSSLARVESDNHVTAHLRELEDALLNLSATSHVAYDILNLR